MINVYNERAQATKLRNAANNLVTIANKINNALTFLNGSNLSGPEVMKLKNRLTELRGNAYNEEAKLRTQAARIEQLANQIYQKELAEAKQQE